MKKILHFLLTALILFYPGLSLAEDKTEMPTMMVGQTIVSTGTGATANVLSYGGMTGNFAVLNFDPNASVGFKSVETPVPISSGLRRDECTNGTLTINSLLCFVLGTGKDGSGDAGSGKLMNSRTTVGSGSEQRVVSEMPALFLGGANVMGDAYLLDSSNFAFWGRNLAEGSDSTNNGATWKPGANYALNQEAQSFWRSDQSEDFRAKTKILADGAESIEGDKFAVGAWYLQAESAAAFNDQNNIERYPEGKVWLSEGDLIVNTGGPVTYHGKGTVIVHGNLTINSHSISADNSSSGLGFIVYGDVIFAGGNHFEGSVLALKDSDGNGGYIAISSSGVSALYGSYVVESGFSGCALSDCSNFLTRPSSLKNVQFIYNPKLDESWPPGFRYLNISKPSDVGNKTP